MDSPTFLALETSSLIGGVAICHGQGSIKSLTSNEPKKHGEVLNSLIDELLTNAGISFGDLDFICLGAGPGSFTGLRVAASIAKTIGYVCKIPLLAFSSHDIIASLQLKSKEPLPKLVLVNAHNRLIYTAKYNFPYQPQDRINEISLLTPEEINQLICEPTFVVGNAFLDYEDEWSNEFLGYAVRETPSPDLPQVEALAQLALTNVEHVEKSDWNLYKPLYFRSINSDRAPDHVLLKPFNNKELAHGKSLELKKK